MKPETKNDIERIYANLRTLWVETYNWDYDKDTLYCIEQAMHHLKEAIR